MYALDSNVIIEFLNKGPRSATVEKLLAGKPAAMTSIAMQEAFEGARTDREWQVLESLFEGFAILDHDQEAARAGARATQLLARKGSMINAGDLFIAGICLANDATLVTFDRDFTRVPGLKVLGV